MTSELLIALCSKKKLDRDSAASQLNNYLLSCSLDERIELENELINIISCDCEMPWETKHGCLLGAKSLLSVIDASNERECVFITSFKEISRQLLTDIEVRVRLEAGNVLGELCRIIGTNIYFEEKDYVLHLIKTNLDRQIGEDESSRHEQMETEKLVEKLTGFSEKRYSCDSTQIFHDTAGWKNLETSLKCLEVMILGCGTNFQPFVDQELLSIIFQTLVHTNRFVRETGFYVCSALVSCGKDTGDHITETNPVFIFGHEFSKYLALGLADNWSQVRLAASNATRHFLISLPNVKDRECFYEKLLPRMCLNRYYVAEGVRIYSQETWRQVTGSNGRFLVQKYIQCTVDYYIQATESDNHAVREAACACIAELASKIEPSSVRPYVPLLLQTLLQCFQDDSWPVRDASCVASGHFVSCFPEESLPVMDSLYLLFFNNLGDPIASVRQGAAVALSNVARAYGDTALQKIFERAKIDFKEIKSQPAEIEKYKDSEVCENNAQFGIIKQRRDNDLELHSDKQMYSCGSLAPKMGRGSGCSDHKFRRESQPWERADGCVYLLSEVSSLTEATKPTLQLLPDVAEACSCRHYSQYVVFLETICKHLPNIAKNVGVKPFKMYLDLFIDPIFHALESESALTSSAASQCLNQFGTLIGLNILRARVEKHNPRFLQQLDANVFIAPF